MTPNIDQYMIPSSDSLLSMITSKNPIMMKIPPTDANIYDVLLRYFLYIHPEIDTAKKVMDSAIL